MAIKLAHDWFHARGIAPRKKANRRPPRDHHRLQPSLLICHTIPYIQHTTRTGRQQENRKGPRNRPDAVVVRGEAVVCGVVIGCQRLGRQVGRPNTEPTALDAVRERERQKERSVSLIINFSVPREAAAARDFAHDSPSRSHFPEFAVRA